MDHAQLRDDLAFTDRMIAESQLHITRLKKIISDMMRDAQDTDLARDVLASYAAALTRHEAQRKLIVSKMDKHPVEEIVSAAKPPAAGKPPSPGKPRNQAARRARNGRRAARR